MSSPDLALPSGEHSHPLPDHEHPLPEHAHIVDTPPLPDHEHDLPDHTHAPRTAETLQHWPQSPADENTYIPAADAELPTRLDIPGILRRRTRLLLAASDSRNRQMADHVCNGNGDHHALSNAVEDLAKPGGKIELSAGTYAWDGEGIVNRDNVWVDGHERGTVLVPSSAFRADGFMLKFYIDESRPLFGCKLSNVRLSGEGVKFTQVNHGVLWAVQRGRVRDVRIWQMPGDGLWTRSPGDSCRDNIFDGCDIGACGRYGMNLDLPDSHISNCIVRANAVSNVFGLLTGCMVTACHFFGSWENQAKQTTLRNVHLKRSSRTRITGGKIEWAQEEVIWLDGDPKGGSITLVGVGVRGGSGKGDGLFPQMKVTRSGGSFWKLNLGICQFDSDVRKPSWNVWIQEGAVRSSRATGCTFEHAVEGDITQVAGLTVL